MITRKVRIQLSIFVIGTLLVGTFIGLNYARVDRIFGSGYTVTVEMAESGGIFTTADVTYRGVSVGRVVDMWLDGDGVKVESKDGTLESGTKLPSDFPKEIPLVEGEVVSATSVKTDGKQGFVVGLSTKASAEDVANEAVTEFEKAGFETLTKTVSGNSAFLGFKSDKWEVAVSVGSEGETTVSYIVSAVE